MIRTARLVLRPARANDLDDLHAVFSDPRAMQYWDSPPYQDRDQTRALLAGMIAADPTRSCDFVVEYQGRARGKAGCWRLGEVGFILHPDIWGQGLAYEALGAALPAAFARLPMAAITADVDPRNAASLRVLAKLGFVETGRAARTIKVGDVWCDSVYLALDRPPDIPAPRM